MVAFPENSIPRAICQALVATAVFCCGSVVFAQAPPAAANGSAPGVAAGAPPPAGVSAGTPAPGAKAEATVSSSARRSGCERWVAVLSGKTQDRALLDSADVQQLAGQVPDLVTCAAIKGDTESLCDPLKTGSAEHRQYSSASRDCIYSQSIFHEARAYPKGRAFMFSEVEWKQCDNPAVCNALREATRSGDEKKCAETGAFQSICRAYVKLDKSLCHVEGDLPKRQDGNEEGDGRAAVEKSCKETIESRASLGRGLEEVAKSGSPRERQFAKAALRQPDACGSFAKAAMEACVGVEAPVPAPAAAEAPVAQTPASKPPAPPRENRSEERSS